MPVPSPAGPIPTLDDLIAEAKRLAGAQLATRFPSPFLLIGAPMEVRETSNTQMRSPSASPAKEPPTLAFALAPGRFNPDRKKLTLGRASVCDVILPFASMSKVHAYVRDLGNGSWQLEDAGSTNGTALDGQELVPGRPVGLQDGAKIEFGDVPATFRTPNAFHAELTKRVGVKK